MSNVRRPGVVSVVIVNYEGADDTLAAMASLTELEWPAEQLEIIVVDNGSSDDSVARPESADLEASIIALDDNLGFAGGANRGASAATGEYLAFLNNDARADRSWLSAAVEALERDQSLVCVASKIADWEGRTVDFVDAAMAFYGHGFKLHAGEVDSPLYDVAADVLFASGAAMVVDAEVFHAAGGFDDRYFMFFEDVDLGWRFWLMGHRVRYVPESLVHHRHHATMSRFRSWREDYLLERNALFTIFKNYDDEHLRASLGPTLLLTARRGLVKGGDDPDALDLAHGAVGEEADDIEITKTSAASLFAIDALARSLPDLAAERQRVQRLRRRSDHEIFRLWKLPLFANIGDPEFVGPFDSIVRAFDLDAVFAERRRVLVATGDVLEPRMAGPAIRAWQIARVLAREHHVRLVTTERATLTNPAFEVERVDGQGLEAAIEWSDVVIFQGNLMALYPALRTTDKVVVADIYDPFHLEVLEQARSEPADQRRRASSSTKQTINEQLARGDFFLCASEKQRDFWLGQLAGVGRLNPATYDENESLSTLIDVVPFGVSDDPPERSGSALKGVVPGIGADDKVVLWGGGIYNWFDPLTLLRAIDKLRQTVPEVRLFFLGLQHPNPHVGEMKMAVDAIALAEELGLVGTHVFFNEGWVPYEERQNFLLEADIGVSTHLDHVETAFSFRTRILDYFWASLPVVATSGDSLATEIESAGAGIAVAPGDVDGLVAALQELLTDDDRRAAAAAASGELAQRYRWTTVLRPVVEFCRAPRRAPDLVDPLVAEQIDDPLVRRRRRRRRLGRDLGIAAQHLRSGSFTELVRRVLARLGVMARREPVD